MEKKEPPWLSSNKFKNDFGEKVRESMEVFYNANHMCFIVPKMHMQCWEPLGEHDRKRQIQEAQN
jgi:hypothetical protein